jgi:hypothetical protein
LLGHASPLLTLSVYTQVLDDEIMKAGAVLLSAISLGINTPVNDDSVKNPGAVISLARLITLSTAVIAVHSKKISEVIAHIQCGAGERADGISLTAVFSGGQGRFSDGSRSQTGLTDVHGDVHFEITTSSGDFGSSSLTVTETVIPVAEEDASAITKLPVKELVPLS